MKTKNLVNSPQKYTITHGFFIAFVFLAATTFLLQLLTFYVFVRAGVMSADGSATILNIQNNVNVTWSNIPAKTGDILGVADFRNLNIPFINYLVTQLEPIIPTLMGSGDFFSKIADATPLMWSNELLIMLSLSFWIGSGVMVFGVLMFPVILTKTIRGYERTVGTQGFLLIGETIMIPVIIALILIFGVSWFGGFPQIAKLAENNNMVRLFTEFNNLSTLTKEIAADKGINNYEMTAKWGSSITTISNILTLDQGETNIIQSLSTVGQACAYFTIPNQGDSGEVVKLLGNGVKVESGNLNFVAGLLPIIGAYISGFFLFALTIGWSYSIAKINKNTTEFYY